MVARRPDPSNSTAFLFGSSTFTHPDLHPLPAVRNNVRDLRAVLLDPHGGGLRSGNCVTLVDEVNAATVGGELQRATRRASDTILVYYAGHGLLDDRGELYLTLPETRRDLLGFTGLPFARLREVLEKSPARNRVLLLDCCFSGRALEAMGQPSIHVKGTFTLTAAPSNRTAHAPRGQSHTAFTGALLTVLTNGIPGGDVLLTLDDIHHELLRMALKESWPEPQRQATGTAGMLALSQNRAHPTLRLAPAVLPGLTEQPGPPGPPGSPEPVEPVEPARQLSRRQPLHRPHWRPHRRMWIPAGALVLAAGLPAADSNAVSLQASAEPPRTSAAGAPAESGSPPSQPPERPSSSSSSSSPKPLPVVPQDTEELTVPMYKTTYLPDRSIGITLQAVNHVTYVGGPGGYVECSGATSGIDGGGDCSVADDGLPPGVAGKSGNVLFMVLTATGKCVAHDVAIGQSTLVPGARGTWYRIVVGDIGEAAGGTTEPVTFQITHGGGRLPRVDRSCG